MNRREFLKTTGIVVGGSVVAGAIAPVAFSEKRATFNRNESFWATQMLPPRVALTKNIDVDFAVIGGGYTGLSSAYFLKKYNPQLRIILLEARRLGSGASGRHGGMILPQPPLESFEIATDINLHKITYELTSRNMQLIKEIVQESNIDCDLLLNGYLHTINDEEDLTYYKDYVKEVNAVGMPLEFWDALKTEEQLGTDVYSGAVYDPNGGSIHAVKFINALAKLCESVGVEIYENSEVSQIHEGKTIELQVGAGSHTVKAKNIVLATNGYTSKLGYFNSSTLPVHVQSAVTTPLTEEQIENIGWESKLPFFDSRNYLFHLVLRDDNRIVIGGGSADYYFRGNLDFKGDITQVYKLTMQELLRIFPSLNGITFESVWDGVLCMNADEVPTVGVTGEHKNIYYGLAYNGQGVNMSVMFGNVIASVFSKKPHGWEKTPYFNYESGYIPPEPYRWIGATLMMKYYKNQDES